MTGCDNDANKMNHTKPIEPLAILLERELIDRYGPLVSNDALRVVLGYASKDAFRQALSRNTVPVPIFPIENRRGKFALARDVAIWLATQREAAVKGIAPANKNKK